MFSPMIALLNKLSFFWKFFVVGVLVLSLLSYLGYALYGQYDAGIVTTRMELNGVADYKKTVDILHLLIQRRDHLLESDGGIESAIQQTDLMISSNVDTIDVNGDWVAWKAKWSEVKQLKSNQNLELTKLIFGSKQMVNLENG